MDGDSPLSLTSNIIGLLTFVVAIIAGSYARALTFQAKLRYRDEILKAILDTMGAFSETCTLVIGYDSLKNTAYMPHDEFDEMLVNLYMSIFELMAVFLDLACKTSVSAVRTASKHSTRWKNRASEIEAQLSKVRQIYFLARLQDNILERTRSDSSSSQNMGTTPTAGSHEIHANNERAVMSSMRSHNYAMLHQNNADRHDLSRLAEILKRAWERVCKDESETEDESERGDAWQRRERLLKVLWDELNRDMTIWSPSEAYYPLVLCIAVIQTITSAGRQKLQRLLGKEEALSMENTTASRYRVYLDRYGVAIFKNAIKRKGDVLHEPVSSTIITWWYDTDIERNKKITEKAYKELDKAISGRGEMSTRWVIDLKHMLEQD